MFSTDSPQVVNQKQDYPANAALDELLLSKYDAFDLLIYKDMHDSVYTQKFLVPEMITNWLNNDGTPLPSVLSALAYCRDRAAYADAVNGAPVSNSLRRFNHNNGVVDITYNYGTEPDDFRSPRTIKNAIDELIRRPRDVNQMVNVIALTCAFPDPQNQNEIIQASQQFDFVINSEKTVLQT